MAEQYRSKYSGQEIDAAVDKIPELQEKLVAGDNINIDPDTNEIRATGLSLVSETGNKIELECSTTDYKLVAKLYDKNNNLISTSTVIDLPIESLVLSVEYVDTTDHPKSIKITLQNGTVTYVPVGAIVSGLASQADLDALSSRVTTIEGKEAGWDAKAELSDITKERVGLDNVDNTSDETKKTNFTGSIASGNTGFVTGGDVYNAVGNIETALATLTTGSGV